MTQIYTRSSAGEADGQLPVHAMVASEPAQGVPVWQHGITAPKRVEKQSSTEMSNPSLAGQGSSNSTTIVNILNMQGAAPPAPVQAAPVVIINEHCCGIGWGLFIAGWFLGIPWFIGAFMLLCKPPQSERPGLIACAIASAILTILLIISAVKN